MCGYLLPGYNYGLHDCNKPATHSRQDKLFLCDYHSNLMRYWKLIHLDMTQKDCSVCADSVAYWNATRRYDGTK